MSGEDGGCHGRHALNVGEWKLPNGERIVRPSLSRGRLHLEKREGNPNKLTPLEAVNAYGYQV